MFITSEILLFLLEEAPWCFNSPMEEALSKIVQLIPGAAAIIVDIQAKFDEHGVECWEDIALLSEDNLVPPMKTIQCRKLLAAVKSVRGIFA